MVDVFKTNIPDRETAGKIRDQLELKIPGARINFDLEDCDRILRVENSAGKKATILEHFNSSGFYCEELE
jgi:hypothetical protein